MLKKCWRLIPLTVLLKLLAFVWARLDTQTKKTVLNKIGKRMALIIFAYACEYSTNGLWWLTKKEKKAVINMLSLYEETN